MQRSVPGSGTGEAKAKLESNRGGLGIRNVPRGLCVVFVVVCVEGEG